MVMTIACAVAAVPGPIKSIAVAFGVVTRVPTAQAGLHGPDLRKASRTVTVAVHGCRAFNGLDKLRAQGISHGHLLGLRVGRGSQAGFRGRYLRLRGLAVRLSPALFGCGLKGSGSLRVVCKFR